MRKLVACALLQSSIFLGIQCTPAQRQTVIYVDQAVCAVPHALKGASAEVVADICDIELPLARALVTAAGDGGAP